MQIDFFSVGCNTPYKTTKPIRLIELFAGIGSQSKALERLGANFEHYMICEFDKYAVQSYNAIHSTNFKPTDITKITADDLGITETDKYEYIMTYSFPCTDLSVAGKQAGMAKGSGTRSGLLWEVERLLTECKELPQVLLMENVPQVLNGDFGGWLDFLDGLGYRNYYKCLNAKNYGIPQNRDRCFMVSVLGDYYYDFPKPGPLQLRLKDMLESKVDEKYYLSEKIIKGFTAHAERHKEKGTGFAWKPKTGEEIANCLRANAALAPTDNTLIEKCQVVGKLNIPGRHESACRVHGINGIAPACNTCGGGGLETKILEPLAYDEQNKYLRTDGIVGTLTTDGSSPKHNNRVVEPLLYEPPHIIFHGNRYKPIHYKTNEDCEIYYITVNERNIGIIKNKNGWFAIRKLTPLECYRLMGFDDADFYKAKAAGVSDSQSYKQAGNSIVVKVLTAIFKQLF